MTEATRPVRIGTRGSELARIQAGIVRDRLAAVGVVSQTVAIVTEGDRRAPDTPWGEGAFVGAIEAALLGGEIDVAVHSAKDVPTDEDPRLTIAAFLPRADARDVVVLPGSRRATSLADLPHGARVGTDSPRRSAFLRALRPDLVVHPLHGNVDTRLGRLDAGETDALVLAAAGLERLGRTDRVAFALPIDVVPPAPGQGALAVQVRRADASTREKVVALDDGSVRRAVLAERAVLSAAGGGCRAPIGAFASVDDDGRLHVLAGYARADGAVRAMASGATPVGAGSQDARLVAEVLARIVDRAAAQAADAGAPRVLVTRAAVQAPATALALVDAGLAPVLVPAMTIESAPPGELERAVAALADADWVVVTSTNAVTSLAEAAAASGVDPAATPARWASVGGATARAVRGLGVVVTVEGDGSSGEALADRLPLRPGQRVVLPRADRADDSLPARLRERGAHVIGAVAYRSVTAPAASDDLLRAALAAGPLAAVVFTSGSTAQGLAEVAARVGAGAAVQAIPAVCIGHPSARAAIEAGFTVAAVAESPAPDAVAAAVRTVAATHHAELEPRPTTLESR